VHDGAVSVSPSRRAVALAAIAVAGLVGCGRDPDVIITTRLPVKPPGQWDDLLYAMCDVTTKRPNDAVRAIFFEADGDTAYEQTVRCDVLRSKGKPEAPASTG
jgi:hypothetical protein